MKYITFSGILRLKQIQARRSDSVTINKKKKNDRVKNGELCRPADHRKKKKRTQRILRSCQRTKKAMEHEGDGDTTCNWCTSNKPQRLGKGLE